MIPTVTVFPTITQLVCFRKRCRSHATYHVSPNDHGASTFTCAHHLGGAVAYHIARQSIAVAVQEAS